MQFPGYSESSETNAIPVIPIVENDFPKWLEQQDTTLKNWVHCLGFKGKSETFCCIPATQGSAQIAQVLLGIHNDIDFWPFGMLPFNLPEGVYCIEASHMDESYLADACIGWGFGAYEFTRYKKSKRPPAQLVIPKVIHETFLDTLINALMKATYFIRDLINTPAEDMGPAELTDAAKTLLEPLGVKITEVVGDALLKQNYPAIHRVGRASTRLPRLIEASWGNPKHPAVTLVGKGVCFDSGGLDLKTPQGMAFMKKDMAGAAHVLGLASLIISTALPVYLRVLIPAVDNVISGNAYRPGDIIVTRKGLSVEVGNTDAEGRLIVSDALTEAAAKKPQLIVDFTTLTGAARIGLGPDISALFSNNEVLAENLLVHAKQTQDAMVELPLYKPYRKYLDSVIADLNNTSNVPFGGAITAGLFLNEFVPSDIEWAHLDLMAWNLTTLPGRPEGGEAMGIRAVWSYLAERFKS